MKTVKLLAIALASLVIFAAGNVLAADAGYGKQKVVYHINYDDPKAQAGALRNINNHIRAVGKENLEARVVLHGKGVSLLLDPKSKTKLPKANGDQDMTARVASLKDLGVQFNVCNNTLKGKEISWETDLYDVQKGDIVPSGVAELSKLQMEGYTYIKP